jgi:hypothetical protein
MGTIHRSKKMHLTEEIYGGLWLYLKGITLDTMENGEYDFAFNFEMVEQTDLMDFANAILAYVEGDSSIE